MKHEPKKHFDVSKPRRHAPDPTSKPVIVGHHPSMPDPMLRDEALRVPKSISVTSDGDEPESLTVKKIIKKPDGPKIPDLSDLSAPLGAERDVPHVASEPQPGLEPSTLMPPLAPSAPAETGPGAVFTPSSEPAHATPPVTAESRIPNIPPAGVVPTAPPPATATLAAPPTPPEPLVGEEVHIPAGHTVVHHKPRVWVWILVAFIVVAWFYAAADALSNVKLPFEFFKN